MDSSSSQRHRDVPKLKGSHHLTEEKESAMNIRTIGLDTAKNVFQLYGVDNNGKTMLRKQPKRDKLLEYFVNLTPCLIGLEAFSGAH